MTAAYTTAVFDNKNAGTGKIVNVSGISIGGADAGNYHLTNTTDLDGGEHHGPPDHGYAGQQSVEDHRRSRPGPHVQGHGWIAPDR